MAKRPDPITDDGAKSLFVGTWKSDVFDVKPHLALSIESSRTRKSATGQTIKLDPSAARRLAIALLASIEEVEQASRRR